MSHRICHGKPKSGVWAHFDEVSEEGSKRVRCLLCPQDKKPWISVPNATRMAKHLAEEHKTSVGFRDPPTGWEHPSQGHKA